MGRKGISKVDLKRVKSLDLLTYYENYEPNELIKNGWNDYTTRTHSSLHMSNGLWCYWAKNIGGKTALKFFIEVEGWNFLDAALYLRDLIDKQPPEIKTNQNTINNRPFRLPEPNINNAIARNYLMLERGIDKEIVDYCIQNHYLYEAKRDHSIIFIGYDHHHYPQYAAKRATSSTLKIDVAGSKKENCFNIINDQSKVLHVFESAIDLLSYLTLLKKQGRNYLSENYLSIGGATILGSHIEEASIPIALETFLKHNPNIQIINLYLDNDKAGKDTTKKIIYHLNNQYIIHDNTPYRIKDMNELLKKKIKTNITIDER